MSSILEYKSPSIQNNLRSRERLMNRETWMKSIKLETTSDLSVHITVWYSVALRPSRRSLCGVSSGRGSSGAHSSPVSATAAVTYTVLKNKGSSTYIPIGGSLGCLPNNTNKNVIKSVIPIFIQQELPLLLFSLKAVYVWYPGKVWGGK
jgi:hypothetical protein